MFCPKCGDPIETNETFCNKCGNQLNFSLNIEKQNINNSMNNINQYNYSNSVNVPNNQNNQYLNSVNVPNNQNNQYLNSDNKKEQLKMILIGLGIGISILIIVLVCILIFGKDNYYFSEENYDNKEEIANTDEQNSSLDKSKYSTIIITDNTYTGVKITDKADAIELIGNDSVKQKSTCPKEIVQIENNIINKYNVFAVNLCELDLPLAKEIENVFKTVYEEYPSARGYLTNLTLINAPISQGYIAAFGPAFQFATADTYSGYPVVMKSQILLNSSYFLNKERLQASAVSGSKTGHFPPNATMYSPVAHELGHYLSFLAMMKNYDVETILLIDHNNIEALYTLMEDFKSGAFSLSIIEEAYKNYKAKHNTTLTIDEWRATISGYAVAKDNSGNYIYDETIAEAFHDIYLNGDNARDASKYVIDVLKKKLEG